MGAAMREMPSPAPAATEQPRKDQIRAEQVRLLYANTHLGFFVTVVASLLLGFLERGASRLPVVAGWLIYMLLVAAARLALHARYRRAAPAAAQAQAWGAAFTAGAALAGIGWGAAGVLLYAESQVIEQVVLAFVLGGMMLGAGFLLASRPEAFVLFLVPTGIPLATRFLGQGGNIHVAMGLLAAVFTAATVITTWNVHKTINAALDLRFENEALVEDLRIAKGETEVLNQRLELRVRERTAELYAANDRLRAEAAQRAQIEEELLRARKLESLAVLAGGIAHDFNNFLTIVQGNIGLAKTRLEAGELVYDVLEETESACERATSLALQLLTFGKGGAPVRRIVSVRRLVEDGVALARAGSPVIIDFKAAEDLWPAEIDASQISHALHNILLNARQAMSEGGTIEVRAGNLESETDSLQLRAGKYVRIEVRDHGCGIAPENLSRIFDPYFTTKPTGNGLGLATAYAIVRKHHGVITVQSTAGVETTFTIYLPASEYPPAPQPSPQAPLERGSGRILVMDDEEGIRKLLSGILGRLGYDVESAKDGAEAIARYEQSKASGRPFDAVLVDLTVPGGMGGLEAATNLRALDPSVKLIVSSGYSDAPVVSEFRKHGFDAVLPKPWTPPKVSAVFKSVLRPGQD